MQTRPATRPPEASVAIRSPRVRPITTRTLIGVVAAVALALPATSVLAQGDADPFGSELHVRLAHDAAAGSVTTHLLPGCGHAPHRAETRIPGWVSTLLRQRPGQTGKRWFDAVS
jgi:pimeloyl-ACP methyl ester carboxylesterase